MTINVVFQKSYSCDAKFLDKRGFDSVTTANKKLYQRLQLASTVVLVYVFHTTKVHDTI